MEIRGERDKEEIILEKFSKNKLILFTPLSYFTYLCLLTTSKCQLPSKIRNNSMFDSACLLSSNVNVSSSKEYFFFILIKCLYSNIKLTSFFSFLPICLFLFLFYSFSCSFIFWLFMFSCHSMNVFQWLGDLLIGNLNFSKINIFTNWANLKLRRTYWCIISYYY
jgi:hypothetical protein